MSKDWKWFQAGYGWHVIPLDDEKEHIVTKNCSCNPSYSEGVGGWAIHTH